MKLRTLIPAIILSIGVLTTSFMALAEIAAPAATTPAPATATPTENPSPDLNLPETATKEANKNANGNAPNISDEDINRFTNTIILIKDFYVKSVGDKNLLDDAIRGMVSGLDPHSEYLDANAYKTLLMTTSGEFGGVGIEITPEYGILKIVSPMDDTPAFKAGIKSGDYIVAIDGKLVSEMSLQDAVDKMRGKPGSPVVLTILRKGEKLPLIFKMNRESIKIASVKSKMLDNRFAYVRITQFQEPTAGLMRQAILDLKAKNNGKLDGIILDLRNNPGGLLESAVQVVNNFLDSKTLTKRFNNNIVYTEGRLPEAQYSAKATGTDILEGAPIVVLINGGSASASEIVAGALQDYQRGLIVGTPSFGKGSVQTVIPLDKQHALKLTTALYHTPSGRVIQNVGIIPDVRIEDLEVVKSKTAEDYSMIEPIKEYQLKNHLPGTEPTTLNPNIASSSDIALAHSDFGLFEALSILRTMYTIKAEPKILKQ